MISIKDQNNGEQKSERPDDEEIKTEKELDLMDEKWKKKMDEAVLKLRSTLKEKLVQLGIKPEGNNISDYFLFHTQRCFRPVSLYTENIDMKETFYPSPLNVFKIACTSFRVIIFQDFAAQTFVNSINWSERFVTCNVNERTHCRANAEAPIIVCVPI